MATLLSLPNELIVAIFRWGFEEHWPTIDTIRVNFGDFRWNKRLRQLGIQAAAEEASIESMATASSRAIGCAGWGTTARGPMSAVCP
jgi:hypothetical protein